MKRNIVFVIFLSLVLGVCIFVLFQKNKSTPASVNQKTLIVTPSITQSEESSQIKVFTKNLEVPWAIAFLPDRKMLVTERTGKIRIVDANGNLLPEPAANISTNVEKDGEGGLLGIALHPKFNTNNFIYLYYTYKSGEGNTLNRVVRMKFESNRLINEEIIVDSIPGAIYHNGGRIKFGPDGFLYVTTGDARDSSKAQDKNSLAGKILRVTDEGKIVAGNPFNNLVFSYGHRNPQGLAWDTNGTLWETEHGRSNPTGFDEINLIQSGKNYGWEVIQGDQSREGMETPKRNSGPTTTWAPSGAVFVGSSLFFTGLKGEALYEAIIKNNEVVEFKEHLKNQFGRLREVVLGPDGMLYITTSNRDGRGKSVAEDDKIIRVNPQKL